MYPKAVFPMILTAVLLALAAVIRAGAQEVQRSPLDEDKGSHLEVEHVFSAVPPGGFTAVRITVVNKGKEALTTQVNASSLTPAGRGEHLMSGGSLSFSARPEATTVQEWTVPLMMDFSERSGYNDSRLSLGFSSGGRSFAAVFRCRPFDDIPFSAISQGLGGASAATLNDYLRKSRSSASGYTRDNTSIASFLPAHLPGDWRAYTGIDLLALTVDDWHLLQPGVRTALRQWTQLGGQLDLYHNGPVPEAVLAELRADPLAESEYSLGSGRIRLFEWDGKELPGELSVRFEQGATSTMNGGRRQRAAEIMRKARAGAPAPGIAAALGTRSFAAWQVGVILLLFGLLVGPVNLFYLAGPGRRHRIFVTTPLIALGASVVLIAVIFFSDGAGGEGRRVALIELRPDENSAIVHQYQISRTGVLFGNGFVPGEPAVLTPLILENTRWTRLKPPESREAEGQRFSIGEANAHGGDWFQSRSEQAQLIETIRPGRGRFELKPGTGPPAVVSSYPAEVEQLYYQDPVGAWWTSSGPLVTGGTAMLQPARGEDFEAWLELALRPFDEGSRLVLRNTGHKGRVYAISRSPQAGLVDTLRSIDWQDDFTLLHGRLAAIPAP